MGKASEPCTPYQNHHHQLTVETKLASGDVKSLPAVYNGMSNIKSSVQYSCYWRFDVDAVDQKDRAL